MSSLVAINKTFDTALDLAYKCVQVSNSSVPTIAGTSKTKKNYIDSSYEIALIKVFTAWEQFLEKSFVTYMAGASTTRYTPNLYIKKITKNHALRLLCGTREYPDWTDINDVCTLAELYFIGGRPFLLPLREIEQYFNEMKKVRNAIAHISLNARDKFIGLVKAKVPSYRIDITPGEFLARNINRRNKKTFFEHYISYLLAASSKIIRL